MQREKYNSYISERLGSLANNISLNTDLNMLHLNILVENFFRDLLKHLKHWDLKNLNFYSQNSEAIDLIDENEKVIIQVTSTVKKVKLQTTLDRDFTNYGHFHLYFLILSVDASTLRQTQYRVPDDIEFDPNEDIIDFSELNKIIFNLDIYNLRIIYEFIRRELGSEIDPIKMNTNLASLINILAKNKFDDYTSEFNMNEFNIDKKIEFNKLEKFFEYIQENAVYTSKLQGLYSEFDKQGANKSFSILKRIHNIYLDEKNKKENDELFLEIKEKVKDIVLDSSNLEDIALEELELCVDIIIVDAFLKCKIFENPTGH